MKHFKKISLLLALIITLSSFSILDFSALTTVGEEPSTSDVLPTESVEPSSSVSNDPTEGSVNHTFQAGDTIYMDFTNFKEWGTAGAIFYVNFTSATRTDNGGSVVIASADKELYSPYGVTNMVKDNVYSYTVTEENAGTVYLRFWRGTTEKLWNNSVLLTHDEFSAGKNCVNIGDYDGEVGSVSQYTGTPVEPTESTSSSSTQPTTATESVPSISTPLSYGKANNLYVHGVLDNDDDTQAWQEWETIDNTKYFFLPTTANDNKVQIYNLYNSDVTIGTTVIPKMSVGTVEYTKDTTYKVTANSSTYNLIFKKSTCEGAVYVNNTAQFNGTDLYSYLCQSKENSASATGAVLTSEGLNDTDIKKIKGRGNTSWDKDKKGFNITYTSAITVDGMDKTKKYSMLANYQDASLSRNRILYDLADAVDVPYSSDSRYVDFFINGQYIGAYQMCQKVEVGSSALVSDMSGEEYLNSDGTMAADFPFMIEVDGSAGADDNYFSSNGNKVTINAPEMDSSMAYYNEVKSYVSNKYNEMFTALKNNVSNLSDYIDIDSYAKVYLINELGKNWDVGVSSYYFVYKQDTDGKYRFFASPVWDYDNSLGNAVGIMSQRTDDYEEPTGWWVRYKQNQSGSTRNSISAVCANTTSQVFKRASTIWWQYFVPALQKFTSTNVNTGELFSSDVYYNLVKDSAEINYLSGWQLNTGSWICDHSNLITSTFDYKELTYTQSTKATTYDISTFKGEWDYTIDWLNSRTAWLSNEFKASHTEPVTQPTQQPTTQSPTQPTTQPTTDNTKEYIGGIASWDFNSTGKTAGENLNEYGSKSGYNATNGSGTLTTSINGTDNKAIEWSDAEYGENGNEMVPIFKASSKNQWGIPYILISFSATDYSSITLSMSFAGSSKAPAEWKLQYSTDGEGFTDTDCTFAIAYDSRKQLTAYIDKFTLPESLNGAEKVYLQLIPTSTATISGGVTSDEPTGGEIALNNIIVDGVSSKSYELGDVNMDGVVNVKDGTLIQKYLANYIILSENCLKYADTDKDMDITIKDASQIQKYCARLISSL